MAGGAGGAGGVNSIGGIAGPGGTTSSPNGTIGGLDPFVFPGASGGGGGGGGSVSLTTGTGGNGGSGGISGTGSGGGGRSGGSVGSATATTNAGLLTGGTGGAGGRGQFDPLTGNEGGGGGGGGGGFGLLLTTSGSNSGTVEGGSGGGGNASGPQIQSGGGGGGSGGGALLLTGGGTYTNSGTLQGGAGGAGGNSTIGNGGGGGGGGIGAVLTSGGIIAVTSGGSIIGGTGGIGGSLGNGAGLATAGNGGAGGAGVWLTSGGTVTNAGTISGGNGGARGTSGGINGVAGAGGEGIVGGNLSITNSGTINGGLGVTQANAITFTGGTNTLVLEAGSTITGNVVAFSGADTLAFGGSTNANFDVSQIGTQYQGFGVFQKTGTSTWTLTGTSASATNWTVSGGTLEVGDASHAGTSLTGNVTVGASGTLMGHGTIDGTVANMSGGIVAPGGTIGTLTVASYTQGSTSTLQIEVSPTAASKLAVTGAASLNGTLSLVYDPGVYSATTYNIVHAGSVTGTFTTVNASGSVPSGLDQSIAYDSTDVDLVLANPGSSLIVRPTNDTVFSSLDTSALLGGQQANATLLGHLAGAHSGTGSETIETALAATSPTQLAFNGGAMHLNDAVAQLPDAMTQLGGWFRATGTFASLSSSSVPGVDTQGGGFMAGLDRPIAPNLTAGIALGYSHTNLSQHDSESGTLDTPRIAAYGSYTMGPWAFDGTVGYAYDRVSEKRPISGIGTASGNYDAHEATGAAQASYRFDYAGFSIMPNAGLTYVHLFNNGVDEGGAAGFDLDVMHRNADSLRPFIGISASTPITTAGGLRLVPEGDIRYSHELFATAPSLVSVGGGNFVVNGITPSHDLLTLGGGITAALSDRLALFADYHATLPTGNYWQQTISAGARYKF